MQIKALIVDDEQSAQDVLNSLLKKYCPTIEVVGICSNVTEAVEAIKTHNPKVVFLDIEMPNYAGYEIVSFFDDINFDIIFVTAYDNYAVKAFDIAAVDYLLKPLDIERLIGSVEKLTLKIANKQIQRNYTILMDSLKNPEANKIVIPFQGGQKVIETVKIIAIEAQESYSCLYMDSGNKFIVSKNLKHFESILKDNKTFFRSHKSWIINIKAMNSFSKSKLEIKLQSNITAKLSKYRKAEFENAITN